MAQVGSALTVKEAAAEATTPHTLLNWARYCLALSLSLVITLQVLLVALATFWKLAPPSVLTCHWIVGAGLPVALAQTPSYGCAISRY